MPARSSTAEKPHGFNHSGYEQYISHTCHHHAWDLHSLNHQEGRDCAVKSFCKRFHPSIRQAVDMVSSHLCRMFPLYFTIRHEDRRADAVPSIPVNSRTVVCRRCPACQELAGQPPVSGSPVGSHPVRCMQPAGAGVQLSVSAALLDAVCGLRGLAVQKSPEMAHGGVLGRNGVFCINIHLLPDMI